MPESEGSNVDSNTGESGTVGVGPDGKIRTGSKHDWQGVGQSMESAKDKGQSY